MDCTIRLAAMAGVAALMLTSACPAAAQATHDQATFTVRLRPARAGDAEVVAIEVTGELRGGTTGAVEPFSLQAPITYASITGIADRVEHLELRDASGTVPLAIADDPVNPAGFPWYRHWRATRAVVRPVTYTYRARPQSTPPAPGPVFSLRAHAGGISAAGAGFLVMPETTGGFAMRLRWDLSDLAPGATVASTFGDGDVDLVGEPAELLQAYYMAGPLGRFAPAEAGGRFFGYWLGRPAFDPAKELAWALDVYRFQQSFFGETPRRPYRVFMRALPGATGGLGGTALQNSFMIAMADRAPDPSAEAPRESIAHEMGHMFVGQIDGGAAGGGPWFSEGLNVHYTRLVLLRSGLSPVSAYEKSINDSARRYYGSAFRNESAASLDRLGFSAGIGEGGAQNLPYHRGSLYFATVDAKIREASGGRRSLDDVMRRLFEQRRGATPFDREALLDAFAKEYGTSARSDFESVNVRGETLVPPSGAFGPCFARRPARVTLQGVEADGYQWARVAGIPDEECRRW